MERNIIESWFFFLIAGFGRIGWYVDSKGRVKIQLVVTAHTIDD